MLTTTRQLTLHEAIRFQLNDDLIVINYNNGQCILTCDEAQAILEGGHLSVDGDNVVIHMEAYLLQSGQFVEITVNNSPSRCLVAWQDGDDTWLCNPIDDLFRLKATETVRLLFGVTSFDD